MVLTTTPPEELPSERLEIRFEANGPIELSSLGESFLALSRAFDRHVALHFTQEPRPQVKLFVIEVSQGSIRTVIAPFLVLLAEPLAWMTAVNTVKTFSDNLIKLLKQFSGDEKSGSAPSMEDCKSIELFLRPLIGRKSAELDITHAKYEGRFGLKEVLLEYKMKAPELNIASSNAVRAIESLEVRNAPSVRHVIRSEVTMKFFQVNEAPGREKGRSGDRAIIPDVTERDLPLYFPKQSNDFKVQILERTENPFQKQYIVDVDIEYDGDVPRLYRLMHLHQIIDL